MMIDPEPLIVPSHKSGTHKIGDRPTDVAAAGVPHARPHFSVDNACRFVRIVRQGVLLRERRPDFLDDDQPTRIALRDWDEGVAEPITQWNPAIIVIGDIGAGEPLLLPAALAIKLRTMKVYRGRGEKSAIRSISAGKFRLLAGTSCSASAASKRSAR
ncbi:MAG: hypothetical protein H0X36_02960 [Sphingomonadaceae bacterium]|nr:hypothetical protein [Sphingomonadaceae bacterium]